MNGSEPEMPGGDRDRMVWKKAMDAGGTDRLQAEEAVVSIKERRRILNALGRRLVTRHLSLVTPL
jgi:hypothetical protein